MKKSRSVNVFTQGIVRHQSAESAAEGSAADVVGFRYRDGALRPFGDPSPLFVSEQPVVATDKLFHPLLPDGEFLYRVGQSLYWWHRRDVEVLLTLDNDEMFTSWISFGTSVVVSTSKYTRVLVYNTGKWTAVTPLTNSSSIQLSNNPSNITDWSNVSYPNINGTSIIKKAKDGEIIHYNSLYFVVDVDSAMAQDNMVSGLTKMVACIKLVDGNALCISTPYSIQFGASKMKYNGEMNMVKSDTDGAFIAFDNITEDGSVILIMGGPIYCKPDIDIVIDDDVLSFITSMSSLNLVQSLSIYSTRKFDLVDIKKTFREYSSNLDALPHIYKSTTLISGRYRYGWYATFTEIDAAEPYYLLKDIELSMISKKFTVSLKPEDFDNITFRESLVPNGTRHVISPSTYMMDYNSRIHGCGIKTTFSNGDNPIAQATTTTAVTPVLGYMNYIANPIAGLTFHTEVDIMADGQIFTVGRKVDGCLYKQTVPDYLKGGTTVAHYLLLNPIVAYPDSRAISMRVVADMNTVETPASSESNIDITNACFESNLLSPNYPYFSREESSLEDTYRHSIAVVVSFTSNGINHTSNTLRSSTTTYDSNVDAVTDILLSDIAAQLGAWISTLNLGCKVLVTSTANSISISATGGILSVYGASASGYSQPPFVTITNSKVDGSVNQSASYLVADIPLKQSLEANIAYSVGTVQTNVSPPIHAFLIPKKADDINQPDLSKMPAWTPLSAIKHKTLYQSNRLQVWAYGSPIFYELKNSYRIGGQFENLLQVETTVDQMSEGRFGQYPLYCFTDRGLYALEQGADGSVLYAASHPISADGLLTTGGATPLSGAVAFTSGRGVLAVSGRQVIDLSKPLVGFKDSVAEFYDNTEELLPEYLADAKLFRVYILNELIVYNNKYNYAYVYNMDGKMWTRRQIYGEIQRSSSRLLLCEQSSTQLKVSNLEKETLSNSNRMLYISRPLEFGNKGYKKVEQAIARLTEQIQGSSVTMTIWGSIDGVNYAVIQRASSIDMQTSSIRAGRAGASVRYVIIVIECSKDVYNTLQQIDFEVEDRYNSKLR